ncbi:MAG: Gfo/Idh/MocA family oxidoreductase [Candidatus Aminicenantes bacterium]|nr:Gfo/Idh/MocA family oxidoreductase [Candidatus Aminicenantes bacterium]
MINVGIIGYGYWGPNIARNFNASGKTNLISICDLDEGRLHLARSHFPFVKTFTNPEELISSPEINVVAVVTPVFTHHKLAKLALESGKHVFVEKPFTSTVKQGEDLINLAEKRNLKIMVDHTFLFTGAVRRMREIIQSGELGTLLFYDSVRVNLGLFQHDINVIRDLATHDFSIMNYLIDKKAVSLSAAGTKHFGRDFEDVAYVTVHYDNGFIAHFHCNWLSPVKIRKTLISGDKKMVVWDDLSTDEKIKIYDKGVNIDSANGIHKLLVSYRSGDVHIPKIDNTEALKAEVEYFEECIENNTKPFNDGEAGLQVVRLLEAADLSLQNDFKKIAL